MGLVFRRAIIGSPHEHENQSWQSCRIAQTP